MLIKNIIQGVLVNGSVGHVIGFKTPRQARDEKQDIAGIDSDPSVPQNQYDREKLERAKEFEWPLVKFANGRELLVIPSDFTVENADGEMEAMRIQVCCGGGECRRGWWADDEGIDPAHSCVGAQCAQVARTDARARQGGLGQGLRER